MLQTLTPSRASHLLLVAARNVGTLCTLGDVPGHEFHGNQWTEGSGGGAGDNHEAVHDAVQNYTADSAPINVALRNGTPVPSGYKEVVAHLDRAIAASPLETEGADEAFARIVPTEVVDGWKDGDTFVDNGFVSMSEDHDFHAKLAEELGMDANEVADYKTVTISVPKGTGLLKVNDVLNSRHEFAWQKEVILGRGHSFKVSRHLGDVYLEVVK